MWRGVTVSTPPAAYPLAAADLRARLRIDSTDDDQILSGFIASAAALIEGPNGIGVALMVQTWTLTIDAFVPSIVLPGWPVSDVVEVRYLDGAGVETVLPASEYRLVLNGDRAILTPAIGKAWPATYAAAGAVAVDYKLGKVLAAEVDAGLVAALSLTAAHFYENREAVVVGASPVELPMGAEYILAKHRRGASG